MARTLGELGRGGTGRTAEVGSSTLHLLRACPQGAHSLRAKPPHVLGWGGKEVKAKRQAMQTPRPKQRGCKAGTGRSPGGTGGGVAAWQALPRPVDRTQLRFEGCPSATRLGSRGVHWGCPGSPDLLSQAPHHVDHAAPGGRAGSWGLAPWPRRRGGCKACEGTVRSLDGPGSLGKSLSNFRISTEAPGPAKERRREA